MSLRAARNQAAVLLNHVQTAVDRLIITPTTREQVFNTTLAFAQDSPLYLTFLALQLLLAAGPLLLFTAFASSTILFSISAAILFSVFWIGVALCALIPTLFVTITFATTAWLWLAGSFLAAKWVYSFVPVNAKGIVVVQSNGGGKKLMVEKKSEGFQDLEIITKSAPKNGVKGFSNGDNHFE